MVEVAVLAKNMTKERVDIHIDKQHLRVVIRDAEGEQEYELDVELYGQVRPLRALLLVISAKFLPIGASCLLTTKPNEHMWSMCSNVADRSLAHAHLLLAPWALCQPSTHAASHFRSSAQRCLHWKC